MFIHLTPQVAVAGQIEVQAVADAAAQGFTTIVNNRPDDEAPGQPSGDSIRAAALALGLRYVPIPVDQSGFNMAQIDAMVDALSGGKTLAFCRSGTRSTNLWALASAKSGAVVADIIAAAAAGGYNVAGLAPTLHQLGGK